MFIDELKDLVAGYEEFVAYHNGRKDKNFLTLQDELWRVKALIELYEKGGENMAFNVKQKAEKLQKLYWNAVEEVEAEI